MVSGEKYVQFSLNHQMKSPTVIATLTHEVLVDPPIVAGLASTLLACSLFAASLKSSKQNIRYEETVFLSGLLPC